MSLSQSQVFHRAGSPVPLAAILQTALYYQYAKDRRNHWSCRLPKIVECQPWSVGLQGTNSGLEVKPHDGCRPSLTWDLVVRLCPYLVKDPVSWCTSHVAVFWETNCPRGLARIWWCMCVTRCLSDIQKNHEAWVFHELFLGPVIK